MKQDYELINGRQVVKKHVATIHCTNKLSLLERKISNALLFHAFPKLEEKLVHQIKIDELKRLIASNTRNHQALKEALKKLISTVLEWNLLGDNISELEGWNASTILSSVSVQNGVIKYQYSELIKTLLIDPKIYGKINLTIQARFTSSYALALYENCSRYRGLPYTKNIDIETFRKLMGVEEGKYEIFRDFNRRVLNPAITEINTCSDIRVTPEITRVGRAVKSIKFKLEERSIKQRLGAQINSIAVSRGEEDVYKALKIEHGPDKVQKAIDYVTSRSTFKNGEIKNIVGYVASAITNGYEEKKSEPIKKSELSDEQKRQSYWLVRKIDYFRYISADVIKQFYLLDDNQKMESFYEFMNLINNSNGNLNLLVYCKKFGETYEKFILKLKSADINTLLFFEDGFTEYLFNKYQCVSGYVTSFDEFFKK